MTSLVLSLAALVGAAVVTLGVGLPVLGRATRVRRWRTLGGDGGPKPPAFAVDATFEPLDLGEDLLRWPSETPAKARTVDIPELEWPSESWDDPYFGINKTFDPSQLAQAPPDTLRQRREQTPTPSRRRRAPTPQPASSGRGAVQAAQETVSNALEETFFEPARRVQQAASAIPSPDEVTRLVEQMGLAGAVQHIRDRTGWDFKRAAQYLAQAMRK